MVEPALPFAPAVFHDHVGRTPYTRVTVRFPHSLELGLSATNIPESRMLPASAEQRELDRYLRETMPLVGTWTVEAHDLERTASLLGRPAVHNALLDTASRPSRHVCRAAHIHGHELDSRIAQRGGP